MPSTDTDASRPRRPIDPKILPAITALITITVTVFTSHSTPTSEQIFIWAGSAATLIVCYLQFRKCHAAETGRKRAEDSVPGITTPNGPIAPITVIKNDASLPGPPTITHPASNDGDHI